MSFYIEIRIYLFFTDLIVNPNKIFEET